MGLQILQPLYYMMYQNYINDYTNRFSFYHLKSA